MKQHRVIWSTAVLCIIAVGLNVVGNYSLRVGLEHVGMVKSWSPLPYVRAFAHLWVCLGVTFMFGWLIARLI